MLILNVQLVILENFMVCIKFEICSLLTEGIMSVSGASLSWLEHGLFTVTTVFGEPKAVLFAERVDGFNGGDVFTGVNDGFTGGDGFNGREDVFTGGNDGFIGGNGFNGGDVLTGENGGFTGGDGFNREDGGNGTLDSVSHTAFFCARDVRS